MISYKLTIKQNEQLKEYEFNSVELGSLGDIQDELNIDNGKITILKRIGMTNEFLSYVLETPIIIPIETDYIELFDGENEIEIETVSGDYRVLYVTNDPFNYSTLAKDRVKLTLAVLDNQINMKVQKGSIISEINQSSEGIKVNSNKIKLEGITTINDGFSVDLQGNMQCRNANINNLINQSGIYTGLRFDHNKKESARKSEAFKIYVGYKEINPNYIYKRIPLYINYTIPNNFTAVRAYLIVGHQSLNTSSFSNTKVKDIEAYLSPTNITTSVEIAGSGSIEEPSDYQEPNFYVGTRIDNIWGNGIHSYTFPNGNRRKRTEDISSVLNVNKKGIISLAPKKVTEPIKTGVAFPEYEHSAYMSATLYIYGYLDKKE